MLKSFHTQALKYHAQGRPGKVDVRSSKSCKTDYDLSLAYSPGVAAPCLEITKNPLDAYKYTTKGNLVGVVSNGSAVLGLGNIGPLAAKPVMEGKGVLFKQFAGIDVFDIELQCDSIEDFIKSVKSLEPTFGGINLEDIKAPDCFVIEERLKREMNIPVFHDDQHGTSIITAAALINACHLTKRDLSKITIVFNGAGAAALACAHLLVKLGAQKANLLFCDSKGVLYKGREEGLNPYKSQWLQDTPKRSLADAVKGADVFIGLSVAGCLSTDMLKSMAPKPIVFAMANPDPEIDPAKAKRAVPDVIMATGRSDYPNQVNNVLGFPAIFRGALDVRATNINMPMQLAAVHALAKLAREEVPHRVSQFYSNQMFSFGPDYIIPKPFDPRVLINVAPAVAQAAEKTGVALEPIKNMQKYRERLEALEGGARVFMRQTTRRIHAYTKKAPVRMVFPEGHSPKVLQALSALADESIIEPVLIGNATKIQSLFKKLSIDNLDNVQIIKASNHPDLPRFTKALYELRQRKGVNMPEALRRIEDPHYFAAMMLRLRQVDGLVSGAEQNYSDSLRPLLEVVGPQAGHAVTGVSVVISKKVKQKMLFLADTTVHIDPTAEELARIARAVAQMARSFNIVPRVAFLSFTNFMARKSSPKKMQRAAHILRDLEPDLMLDGEMQADTAVNPDVCENIFPFSQLKNGANVLIFPNLDSGNIAYKLVQQLSEQEVLGPFLLGMNRPANVLQRSCSVEDIIRTTIVTALESSQKTSQD